MSEKYALAPRTEQLYPEGPHVTVRLIDLSNDGELLQSWDVWRVIDEEFFGANELRTPDQLREQLKDTEYWRQYHLVAEVESLEGATMIAGVGSVRLSLKEDTDNQEVDVAVYPAWRSKGIGARIAEALREIAVAEGRKKGTSYGLVRPDVELSQADFPAAKLAARLGLKKAAVEHVRTVKLPLDRDLVEDLYMEVEASLGKYRIITWQDEVPEEHMDQWCALLTQLDEDVPDEALETDYPTYGEERIRYGEQRNLQLGIHRLVAVALAPNGTFAGNSYIDFRKDGSRLASQENTLVMPEHRGHKLGLALKLMTHRMLSEVEPRVDTLMTYNNHTNEHMIRINEQLGYTLVAQSVAFQGTLKKA